jgi:hypothetical protein
MCIPNNRGLCATWALTLAILIAAICLGQPPGPAAPSGVSAKFVAGENLRYEVEAIVHLSSRHRRDVKLNLPADCSYTLHAVLQIDVDDVSADGSVAGQVHYETARYDGPSCAIAPRPENVKALQDLQANEITFDIAPAGDVRLSKPPAVAKCEGTSLLLKAAWDLLQVRISDVPIVPGMRSIASRSFLYWPDTFVENMEVAAASMQYRGDAVIAGRPYAWLQYKQVFAPADLPAYIDARTRARDFSGTTFVTGHGDVSLLFDSADRRIVYLHRTRTIGNRMMLKYQSSGDAVPIATYSISEESMYRWLPPQNSEVWLAELHKFESAPPPETPPPAAAPRGEPSLAEAAAAYRRSKPGSEAAEHRELSDLIDRTPKGFERWRRNYCSNGYCFELSIAVPEQTRAVDHTDGTVLLLSGFGEKTITVAVGPMLDRQYEGLTDNELLKQQTARFLASDLWFAGSAGRDLSFASDTLDSRPAGFRDFTTKARDLTPLRGRLVMVLAPYGRLAPVSCAYSASEQATLDATCQTVTGSVVIR